MLSIFTALQDVRDKLVKVDLGAAEKEGIMKEAARGDVCARLSRSRGFSPMLNECP